MHSYTITTNARGERFVSRDDGIGIGASLGNAHMRRFIYEWINGAAVVNQNGQPRPYTLARLHQISPDLAPVTAIDATEGF